MRAGPITVIALHHARFPSKESRNAGRLEYSRGADGPDKGIEIKGLLRENFGHANEDRSIEVYNYGRMEGMKKMKS